MSEPEINKPESAPEPGHAHGGHGEKVHKVNSLAVFAWLVVLTAAEIGVVYLHLPKGILVTALIGTAVLKALLVAIYFMHLKFEGKLIWSMIIGSIIMGAIFLALLLPDMVFSTLHLH